MPDYLRPKNWPIIVGLGILRVLALLPFPLNVRLGKGIGSFLFMLPTSRRQVTETNIELCFPELDESEKKAFCKSVFQNYGAGLVETAMAWWAPIDKLNTLIEVENLEICENAQAQGKGMLMLGAHFSTLDFGGVMASKYIDYSVIYRPQKNKLFDSVVQKGRARHTQSAIKSTQLRSLVRAIKNSETVWYAPDQDEGEENSVYAPFFGQTAATVKATSTLARLTGAPVVMFSHRRKEDDSGYIGTFAGPLENFPSGDDEADAAAVNALMEQQIRLAPTQYYWVHRRFKTQPNTKRGALYLQ